MHTQNTAGGMSRMKGAVKDAVPSPLRSEHTENVAISFFFFFVKYIVSQLACTLVFIFRIVYIVFFLQLGITL